MKKDNKEKNCHKPTFFTLFLSFIKIGFFTIGGGLAMIGIIRHELVVCKKWLKETEFLKIVSIATAIPGAIAVNIAYLIGKRMAGWKGIITSLAGVILPSFVVILLVIQFLFSYFSHPVVGNFFTGAAAAVTALIAYSACLYGRPVIFDFFSIIITLTFFVLLFFFNIHPVLVLLFSTIIRYLLPHKKEAVSL